MFQVHTRLVLGDSHSNLVNCIGLSFMPSQFVFLVGFPLGERVLETSHVPFASFHQFHLTELPPPPLRSTNLLRSLQGQNRDRKTSGGAKANIPTYIIYSYLIILYQHTYYLQSEESV